MIFDSQRRVQRNLDAALLYAAGFDAYCVPEPSVVIHVVKKRFPPKTGSFLPTQDGKRFAFQLGRIVTLTEGVMQEFSSREAAQMLRGNIQRGL